MPEIFSDMSAFSIIFYLSPVVLVMSRLKTVDKLQEKGREHLLMLEIMKTQMIPEPKPFNYVGQFILTYQLDLVTGQGTPVLADKLHLAVLKYIKKLGFDEYDRQKFFSYFYSWGIKAERMSLEGKTTRFYLVNPLHKLDA